MSLGLEPPAEAAAGTGGLTAPSFDRPPSFDKPAPAGLWRHRHLLDVDVLSWPDIELVMRTTDAMREVLARPIAKVPALRGTGVTILFYEASTRTRVHDERVGPRASHPRAIETESRRVFAE